MKRFVRAFLDISEVAVANGKPIDLADKPLPTRPASLSPQLALGLWLPPRIVEGQNGAWHRRFENRQPVVQKEALSSEH